MYTTVQIGVRMFVRVCEELLFESMSLCILGMWASVMHACLFFKYVCVCVCMRVL